MKKLIIILLLLTSSISSQSITFEDILNKIVTNNPSLAALTAENDAKIIAMKSENNLPDPELDFDHKWGNEGVKWGFGVSQSFEWPSVYSIRKNATKQASKAIQYLNNANHLEKILEIKQLLIDIINIRKRLLLMHQISTQMDTLSVKYELGRERGEVSILDINKLNIEKISISQKIKSLETQLNALNFSLTRENGGNDVSYIISNLNNYPSEEILSEEKYEQQLKDFDPQLIQYSLLNKSQELNAKALKASKFPGFSIGYKFENELGNYFNGFSVGVSIPIFSKKHKVEAINATQKAISLQSQASEIDKITQIRAQRLNVISLYQELEQYRPIIEDQNNIGLLKKALYGGEINLITYIQEVNFFIEAQLNYLDIEYKYYQLLTTLNKYNLIL